MKFYIGTTNPYKVREIAGILSSLGCDLVTTDPIDPDETETSFDGNALIKARAYARHSGGKTISEDSGIIVPALGGLPGVWSARFSDFQTVDLKNGRLDNYVNSARTREEIDLANNIKLLSLMEGIEQPYRAAYFRVSLIVAEPDGTIAFKATNDAHGWISTEMRGNNGFGYDPIFIGQDTFGKTYAEMDPVRKNMRSHRRKVLQEFKSWLATNSNT